MKCACGSHGFYANQIVRVEIIVDEHGEFLCNREGGLERNIYDAETPFGPYICVRCGKEYNELEE